MMWSLGALLIGFIIDMLAGDPHGFPHPVILIGKLIAVLEKLFRRWFPKSKTGERLAGLVLWILVCAVSLAVPALILWGLKAVTPWLAMAAESIMCWQILAARSLKTESMKVWTALKQGSVEKARYAVSMIVGRDTKTLDEAGITRATVETIAENTSDGVIAPLLFMAVGGAPLGFLYKAVNTMDSMLGYTDPPYTNIGLVPAWADDIFNYIPARISALLMLLAGRIMDIRGPWNRKGIWFDVKNGWRIFKRDRYKHASPNSAQTESVCAGMLRVQLAGDAWYHGVLHRKPFIGDHLREIETEDIPRTCSLIYATAVTALLIFGILKLLVIIL